MAGAKYVTMNTLYDSRNSNLHSIMCRIFQTLSTFWRISRTSQFWQVALEKGEDSDDQNLKKIW